MASQTLRPHRSPSPSPATTPVNPVNPAKLTRQSLGPPSSTSGAAKGFAGLGISSPGLGIGSGQPRHVSSSVALGGNGSTRESLSPRPSMGNNRAVSGSAAGYSARPSSEFLPGGMRGEAKTPEAEQIDQWFKHLASWEATLEEMAAASTDQNFTEELGAIEQWFRVLSEAERTAALYSLLQHSTPVQIRFFQSVLHHMAQSDPMTALLSPNPANAGGMEARLSSYGLKSPSAGGGSGFAGSPVVNQFLNPESALDANAAAIANKNRLKQNRISAPGTLQPHDRWQGQLDQVMERGTSPGAESTTSSRSRSPQPDVRPKSTIFAGKDSRSPRLSGEVGLGLHQPVPEAASPAASPFLGNPSWASMANTPVAPMFTDPKIDGVAAALTNMANMQNLNQNRIALEDPRKYRRAGAGNGDRNVSGQYNDDGDLVQNYSRQPGRATSPLAPQGGFPNQNWATARSPVLDQFGLSGLGIGGADPSGLSGLSMSLAQLGINPLANANPAQIMALAQAQAQQQLNTAASFASAGYGGSPGLGYGNNRAQFPRGIPPGRRSPMLGKSHSPTPDRPSATTGGGAGGGAGVAGPDDVDMKILEDVSGWLRVLRLHKYTTNFEKSNWRDMIMMNDNDLQDKGVNATGARNKFLKVFYNVRTKEGINHPPGQEEYAPGAKKDDDK